MARSQPRSAAAAEAFPPLSVSLAHLLKDGSDRAFRQLIYSLIRLSTLMVRNREHFAAYIGVSDPQFMMLMLTADQPGVTVGGLAEQLSVSSQFVTTEIAKLTRRNLIGKKPNPADRRSMLLELTSAGRTLLRELAPLRRRINDLTFRSLSAERAATLHDIVGVLIVDAQSALHELEAPQMRGATAPSVRTVAGAKAAERRNAKP